MAIIKKSAFAFISVLCLLMLAGCEFDAAEPPVSIEAPATAPSPATEPATAPTFQPYASIASGEQWYDNNGKLVQAHGGGILRLGDTFYWFGEDRTRGLDRQKKYVACYSSKDLMNWTFRRRVLQASDPEDLGPRWRIERPKVFHNAKTGKFVMYVHLDGLGSGYQYAHVGVFICDTVDGDYQYVHSFRPLDEESRDIGQFVDDDGSGYLIFEARPTHGFFIAALSDDYLTVTRKVCFIESPLEGGALVHYGGLYYVVGSYMSGWSPNPNQYATSAHLEGPWSEFRDIAPPATNTFNSQSSFLLKIVGSQSTTVIFCADQWRPRALWDSRYLWMPLIIGNGTMQLPQPQPWSIDLSTGLVSFQ